MNKLQTQVDVMEKNPDIGFVCNNYITKIESEGSFTPNQNPLSEGIHNYYELGRFPWLPCHTAGVMVRNDSFKKSLTEDIFFRFRFLGGDTRTFLSSIQENGKFYFLSKTMHVYRRLEQGASFGNDKYQLMIDGHVIGYYYITRYDKRYCSDDFFYKMLLITFPWRILEERKTGEHSVLDVSDLLPVLDFVTDPSTSHEESLRTLRDLVVSSSSNAKLSDLFAFLWREVKKRKIKLFDGRRLLIWRILSFCAGDLFCLKLRNFFKARVIGVR